MEHIIQVKNLRKEFNFSDKELGLRNSIKKYFHHEKKTKIAVNDISFSIEQGEIVGFLGPNGAGKTTSLKMLSGILYPTCGQASVLGYVPWERNNKLKHQMSIVLGQKNQLWWDLPANESLYLNKCIYNIPDEEYKYTLDELTDLLNVRQLLTVQVRNMSLGERMKMELIAALLHKPKVIFLDEPTIGLDMIAQKNIREFLKYYNEQQKTTVMLTSHYLADIENLCKRVIVINHGSVVYDGDISNINEKLSNKKIIKVETPENIKSLHSTNWTVVGNDNGKWVLETQKESVKNVINELFAHFSIVDFSIEDVPLENSLEALYQ